MDILMKFEKATELYNNKKHKSAYQAFLELAEKEEVNSMMQVAYMLINGEGVQQNIREGYIWYKKTADKNKASAQYYYGWYCLDNKKIETGKKYLNMAIKNQYKDAIYDVAKLYAFEGFGYEKDINKAIFLYEQACLLNKKDACLGLYLASKELGGKKKAIRYIQEKIGYFKYFKIILFGK